jgi:hypothetical protein
LNNAGKTFDTYCITEELGIDYPGEFGMGNILSGFKVAGIFQPDRGVFSEYDSVISYYRKSTMPCTSSNVM